MKMTRALLTTLWENDDEVTLSDYSSNGNHVFALYLDLSGVDGRLCFRQSSQNWFTHYEVEWKNSEPFTDEQRTKVNRVTLRLIQVLHALDSERAVPYTFLSVHPTFPIQDPLFYHEHGFAKPKKNEWFGEFKQRNRVYGLARNEVRSKILFREEQAADAAFHSVVKDNPTHEYEPRHPFDWNGERMKIVAHGVIRFLDRSWDGHHVIYRDWVDQSILSFEHPDDAERMVRQYVDRFKCFSIPQDGSVSPRAQFDAFTIELPSSVRNELYKTLCAYLSPADIERKAAEAELLSVYPEQFYFHHLSITDVFGTLLVCDTHPDSTFGYICAKRSDVFPILCSRVSSYFIQSAEETSLLWEDFVPEEVLGKNEKDDCTQIERRTAFTQQTSFIEGVRSLLGPMYLLWNEAGVLSDEDWYSERA